MKDTPINNKIITCTDAISILLLAFALTICVLKTLNPPPIRLGAEYALIPDAKVTIVEVITAGVITDHITSKNILNLDAPIPLAASIVE